MRNKIKEFANRFSKTKLGIAMNKYHLMYLLLPFFFYMVLTIVYYLCAAVKPTGHEFNMSIDNKIPFIKYFLVFYLSYYFLPPLLLWRVASHDKKKFWKLFCSVMISTVIAVVIFLTFQVHMIRAEGYPNNIGFLDIRSISDLFDFGINVIYKSDPKALNCFPSLHAVLGVMMVLAGIDFSKNKSKVSLWLRIVAIVFGTGCVLSTVFIKQHYFIDMLCGAILMLIVYLGITLYHKIICRKRMKSNIDCKN